MVKIKFSAVVGDARGKIGGNVFSRNGAGAYIRTYVKGTNPQSTSQQNNRALFAAVTVTWKGLTQAQRNGWNDATDSFPYQDSLGDTKIYSGEQLYNKFNMNMLLAGQSLGSTPPVPVEVNVPGFSGIDTLDDSSIILSFVEAAVPTDVFYAIYATGPLSAGINAPARTRYRLIAGVAAAADPEADLITPYTNVFGAPVVGAKVFFRVRAISTVYGQGTAEAQQSGIVVASV